MTSRHRGRRSLLAGTAVLCLAVATGCAVEPDAALQRDPEAPLQTDRTRYELRTVGTRMEVRIPFTYRNATGDTVYLVNCNGDAPPSLEKEVDGEWVTAWSPVVNQCLSPPITIPAGETYADTLAVVAGRPSSDMHPKFDVQPIPGTYRLVWHGAVHHYDPDRPGFGDPLPLAERVSNPFSLELR